MAKYSRFDVRNKKNARHKKQSLNRDIRIRRVEEDSNKVDLRRFADLAYAEDDYFDEEYFSEKYD